MPRLIRKSLSKRTHIRILLASFGFKHGRESRADFVLDVRFLPNPFYVPGLKKFSGRSSKIQKYIFSHPAASLFLKEVEKLVILLADGFIRKGRQQIKIAFGCTGGRHRSVAVVERLKRSLSKKGYPSRALHRDE